jgi:hypothetical protein
MEPLCPSAPADAEGARVFGLVRGETGTRRVAYLTEATDMTEALAAAVAPALPNEVLRTAASCAGCRCRHFDGQDCTLASRIATMLPPVVGRPPPCAIRPQCRWWRQEGLRACLRCPQVVTAGRAESMEMAIAAEPPSSS